MKLLNHGALGVAVCAGALALSGAAVEIGGAVEVVEFLNDPMPTPSCHATTIAEGPKGLVAAWFGGSAQPRPPRCLFSVGSGGRGFA